MEKYPCPCCGYLTYPVPREDAIAYICPVCFWENDVFVCILRRTAAVGAVVQRPLCGLSSGRN